MQKERRVQTLDRSFTFDIFNCHHSAPIFQPSTQPQPLTGFCFSSRQSSWVLMRSKVTRLTFFPSSVSSLPVLLSVRPVGSPSLSVLQTWLMEKSSVSSAVRSLCKCEAAAKLQHRKLFSFPDSHSQRSCTHRLAGRLFLSFQGLMLSSSMVLSMPCVNQFDPN